MVLPSSARWRRAKADMEGNIANTLKGLLRVRLAAFFLLLQSPTGSRVARKICPATAAGER